MMNWRKSLLLAAALFAASSQTFAQDNLINALNNNVSDKSKEGFVFKELINLGNTPIKDQGSTGTCWSYSGNSFLESEMIRHMVLFLKRLTRDLGKDKKEIISLKCHLSCKE